MTFRRYLTIVLSALMFLGFVVVRPASPCSSFAFPNKGFLVFGTNYDNTFEPGFLFLNRRNVRKTGWEAGTTGRVASWTSRYGSVTISCAGYQLAWGGMNEAGLVFSTMALSETVPPGPDERPHLAGAFWWQYILDTCATIEDLKAAAGNIRISDTQDHYLVCDRTGACAVIECLGGRLIIRSGADFPVWALTNATYQRCLDFWNEKPAGRKDSYSSIHRFYRLADGMSKFTDRSPEETVSYAFGMLAGVASSDTRWSLVFDTGNRIMHLKSSLNPKLRSIDLSRIDFSCGGQGGAMLDAHAQLAGDITKAFQPYTHERVWNHILKAIAHFRPGLSEDLIRRILGLFESFTCAPAVAKQPAGGA